MLVSTIIHGDTTIDGDGAISFEIEDAAFRTGDTKIIGIDGSARTDGDVVVLRNSLKHNELIGVGSSTNVGITRTGITIVINFVSGESNGISRNRGDFKDFIITDIAIGRGGTRKINEKDKVTGGKTVGAGIRSKGGGVGGKRTNGVVNSVTTVGTSTTRDGVGVINVGIRRESNISV